MAHEDMSIEIELAEYQMCKTILEYAKAFFADPKNQARFEVWQKEQKNKTNKGEKDEP
ncbi:hypothetical protein LJB76_02380 [Clostridia bacterium OttesenSCG-928-O13]|nr:hypothetical protein [Clostridia bacterium OttesenSCG-928-O13]